MQLPYNKHVLKSSFKRGPGPPSPPSGPGPGAGGPRALVAAVSWGQLGATWPLEKRNLCRARKLLWSQWGSCCAVNFGVTGGHEFCKVAFRNHESCERARKAKLDSHGYQAHRRRREIEGVCLTHVNLADVCGRDSNDRRGGRSGVL